MTEDSYKSDDKKKRKQLRGKFTKNRERLIRSEIRG